MLYFNHGSPRYVVDHIVPAKTRRLPIEEAKKRTNESISVLPRNSIGGVIMDFVDKRKSKRITGSVQVELKGGIGITRDFNTDGVFFVTDRPLTVGEQLNFVMKLTNADQLGPMRLRCRGEVVRVEHGLDRIGAAVAISEYYLSHN